ncbi:MAG: ABC transporter ATP-binding protein [Cyanobacteria bacterium P01_D01_bin.71]
MAQLKFESISKYYGESPAILDVDLSIPSGSFTVLIGPSGCGKSTLLEIAAGLSKPSRGLVSLAGQPVVQPGDETAIVFQNHNLFEWLTVLDNVAFGLHAAGVPLKQRRSKGLQLLKEVGLADYARKLPKELSGGMKQRVAIARALAVNPQVLLMDEPFSSLDYQTRTVMQRYLLALWHHTATTIVMVTHDLEEAIMLADQVVLFSSSPGRILEVIPLASERPRNPETPELRKIRNELRRFLEYEVASHEFTQDELAAIKKEGMTIRSF